MKLLLIISFLIPSIFCTAQSDTSIGDKTSYPILIEQEPEFTGGIKAMLKFIDRNLEYPQIALDSLIEGVVKIRFIVTAKGELINFMVVVSKEKIGFGLEEAAINVVKKMPNWKPGKQNGLEVPMTCTIPIKFSLFNKATTAFNEKIPENIFLISTVKPQFPGGRTAMIEFISKNLKYPKAAMNSKMEGKVLLKFIIDSLGKICCVDIVGEPIGYGLEEEAIRIIRSMPLWTPAYTDEIPVAVYYRMPITFKYYEE